MPFSSVCSTAVEVSAERRSKGAIGGPKWGFGPVRPEQGLLRLRKELGLYANIRPASFVSDSLLKYSPLKEEVAKGTDIIVLRELIGGCCTTLVPPCFSFLGKLIAIVS